ncbi:hypothetical protein BGZ73_007938 [Actinomortierella ambigua]|nr:hypothetical protein BGZ73_007938 [Actinomortierella ambigua]
MDVAGKVSSDHRRKQPRATGESEGRLDGSQSRNTHHRLDEREIVSSRLPIQPRRHTLQPVTQAFPRPKPPGKNRTGLAAPLSHNASSSSRSGVQVSAGKGHDRHGSQGTSEVGSNVGAHKRKALRQLHQTEPKRMAISPGRSESDKGDDDEGNRDVDNYRGTEDREPLLLTPKDIQRTYDALTGIDSRESYKPATQVASSSSQESEVTAVDWSRFMNVRPVPHQRQRSREGLRRESSWTSTTPTLTKQLSMDTFHHQQSAVKTNLSPLIKLRQSQLRQRQQEDTFGSKRRDHVAEAEQDIDGQGRFLFERTLEDWEREDREIAAAAAAEERLFRSQGQRAAMEEPKTTTPPTTTIPAPTVELTKKASISTNLKHTKVPPTPSDSLLRTITFNGDPSKRPAPEFGPPSAERGAVKVDIDYRQEQPLRRAASRATLQQQQQRPQQQPQPRLRSTPTRRTTTTRPGHAGLYTPSKAAKYYMVEGVSAAEKVVASPTMSRYIQLHDNE